MDESKCDGCGLFNLETTMMTIAQKDNKALLCSDCPREPNRITEEDICKECWGSHSKNEPCAKEPNTLKYMVREFFHNTEMELDYGADYIAQCIRVFGSPNQ